MFAVRAANPGESLLEISTLEESRNRAVDNRPPVAILSLETLAINLPKGLKVPVQQTPQIRGPGIARLIQGQRFETGQAHEASSYPNNQITAGDTHSNRQTTVYVVLTIYQEKVQKY